MYVNWSQSEACVSIKQNMLYCRQILSQYREGQKILSFPLWKILLIFLFVDQLLIYAFPNHAYKICSLFVIKRPSPVKRQPWTFEKFVSVVWRFYVLWRWGSKYYQYLIMYYNVLLKVMLYQGPWFASRDKRKAEQNKTLL